MGSELVAVADDGPVRVVTIQRPEVHNAMSEPLMDTLAGELAQAEAGGVRVLVVTGAGEKSFCSGGDLKDFDALRTREAAIAMSLHMQRLNRSLRRSPLVTIAALNGDAYGGGLEFALAFDLRVAVDHARFGFLQVTLGITPAWRGVSRLRELAGRSTAMRLLLTGERFDAKAALGYGLLDRIAPAGGALDGALETARAIAANPPLAVRTVKAMVDAPAGDGDAELETEAEMFAQAWLSPEHWAAVEARAAARRRKGA